MKKLLVLFLALMLTLSIMTGCKKQEKNNYVLTLEQQTITLEKGENCDLLYSITNNGEVVNDVEIKVVIQGDAVTYDSESNTIEAVKYGTATLTATIEGTDASDSLTVNVPEYTIEIAGSESETVELGSKENLNYSVKKDGITVEGVDVTITATGDAITFKEVGEVVNFVGEGEGTIRVALTRDPSVYAEKKYIVERSLWNSDISVNKELMDITDEKITIPGGGGTQFFIGTFEKGTKYMLKGTITVPENLGSTTSVGLAHTTSRNDNSLWFGIQGTESGKYNVLIRNYYDNWASGVNRYIDSYCELELEGTIDCIIIRDGQDYWFKIGDFVGTWKAENLGAEDPTWAGFYSQETQMEITNFEYVTDETLIEAQKMVCASPVAKLDVVNKNVSIVNKGVTFQYLTSVLGPDTSNIPEVEWDLDTTNVTSGTASITDGALALSNDAAGSVKVIAKCADKVVEFEVTISQESLEDSNEYVTVNGGVILNEDGSFEFTEQYKAQNADFTSKNYVELFYAAKLNAKVKGDFTLSFTLSNLNIENGGLLVSLGNTLGNIIIGNGTVEFTSNAVYPNGSMKEKAIHGNFTVSDSMDIVIAVVGGQLTLTINDVVVEFYVVDSDVTSAVNALRSIADYREECPVLITTLAGTTAKISALALEDGTDSEYVLVNSNSVLTTDGFVTTLGNSGWLAKDEHTTRTFYGGLLPEGNFTISFDICFSAAAEDVKFAVQYGNWEFHINNKVASTGVIEGELFPGRWGENIKANSSITSVADTFSVTIKKIDNTFYYYIGETLIGSRNDAPSSRELSFFAFCTESAVAESTVEISNLEVSNKAVVLSVEGARALQAGQSETYEAVILGTQANPEWTLDKTGLTSGTEETAISSDGVLTLDVNAVGSVVVIVTVDGVVAKLLVTVSEQPAEQDTSIAYSTGGVKQDVENGAIIFDNADINGVGDNEQIWQPSSYYALVNTAQGQRAEIRDNFIIEFTVFDYVTTAEYPKLMISLGAKFEQFYISYSANGARIEAFNSTGGDNSKSGNWVNSAYFENFDTTAVHTYKIVCEDGYYKLYVDDTEITGWNTDGNEKVIFRSPESMAIARNIAFSTNSGTVATVSNISVSAVAGKEGKVTATYDNDRFTLNEDGSLSVNMVEQSRNGRDGYHDVDAIYSYGQYIADNSEIIMNISWDANHTYTDEAVLIKFGSDRSIGVVLNDGVNKVEIQHAWSGTQWNASMVKDNSIKLRIVITDGYVSEVNIMNYAEDGSEAGWSSSVNIGNEPIPNIGVMSFGAFVYNTPSNGSVKISNITVNNN